MQGTRLGLLQVELFSHPLNQNSTYPSILADTVWKCSLLPTPTPAHFPTKSPSPARVRANCTGAIIVDPSQQVVKIPWQDESYPNLPKSLDNIAGTRIKNTLVVCGSNIRQHNTSAQQHVVQCFKASLPQCEYFQRQVHRNKERI